MDSYIWLKTYLYKECKIKLRFDLNKTWIVSLFFLNSEWNPAILIVLNIKCESLNANPYYNL